MPSLVKKSKVIEHRKEGDALYWWTATIRTQTVTHTHTHTQSIGNPRAVDGDPG